MSKKKRYRRYEEPKDPLKVASTVFAVLATLLVWVIGISLIVIGIIYKENFWSVGKYFVFSAPSIFVFLVISVVLGKRKNASSTVRFVFICFLLRTSYRAQPFLLERG